MAYVRFTRPDDTPIYLSAGDVLHFGPVPTSGPNAGDLKTGTRIIFKNGAMQDVKETVDVVAKALGAEPE